MNGSDHRRPSLCVLQALVVASATLAVACQGGTATLSASRASQDHAGDSATCAPFARRVLEAINAGEFEGYRAARAATFADTTQDDDRLRSSFERILDLGHLEVVGTSLTPSGDVEYDVRGSNRGSAEITMTFECAATEGRIERLLIAAERGGRGAGGDEGSADSAPGSAADDGSGNDRRANRLPPLRSLQDLDDAARREAIATYLSELAAADAFSGVVRIERPDGVLFSGAVGLASKSYGVPNTEETPFRIGSITKSFIQIVMAHLFEQGSADPDAPFGDYLASYPDAEVAARVTLRQLLEHRGGLPQLRWDDMLRSPNRLARRPADYFRFFADGPLAFPPGTEMQYSNAGYIVLGAVIESITGAPYENAVARYVFEPAAMRQSGFYAADRPHPGVATGYWRCEGPEGPWCTNDGILEVAGSPSGGSYSTAADLVRFYRLLQAAELMPEAWTNWIFTGDWPVDPQATGFDRSSWQSGWAGGAEGVSAVVGELDGLLAIGLSNYDEPAAEDVVMIILRAIGARI